ncbi:MAG: von Willebrand factor type A domain-containing protein [Prevotellaceae bacterium]|jgi:Ca-activated chloride channel family protein|nr:von Willebrand factor type A domain-containing protein [Prevotellaceae bacterium]
MKASSIVKTVLVMAIVAGSVILGSNYVSADSKQKTITGAVSDAITKAPIGGAMVMLKRTSITATTDKAGKYSISVPADSKILVFSYSGYEVREEKIATRSVVNVSLQPQIILNDIQYEKEALDEIVVMAYADKKLETTRRISEYSRNKYYVVDPTQSQMYYYPQYVANTEEYGSFTENKFQLAKDFPLSTFSIDVDAASYSNVRRFINQGQMPPKDAVRTEELINYFNYNYPQPMGKHPINVITEVSDCPWNMQNRLLHVGIKAKDIPIEELSGSNLIFLIDVSGSMSSANKLPLVKSSMKMLVKQLRDIDHVAIVTYAGSAGITLESTSGKDKEKINNAIDKLRACGSTAGGMGIKLAYKIAKENFIKNGNNRLILATDGDFNVGVSSDEDLEQLIEKERQNGVFLTVLGYGMGNYKDSKMQILAQKGNGNHAYIDNLIEAKKVLVSEFGGTLFTIVKDVKLQVEFNPAKVQAYRLIGYESRMLKKEDFNDDTKDAGEMGAGHTVTALYEIIPVGINSNIISSVDDLKYQPNKNKKDGKALSTSIELLTVKIRYKEPVGDASKKIEVPVIDLKMPLAISSANFRFSAAVAQVGMLLHNSPYKSEASYEKAIAMAKGAYGEDSEGYRHEFVKLVENLQLMDEGNEIE